MANHVCPFWVGYLLASPLRKIWQDPYRILPQHIKQGMTVLDIGSAMGFFSIPLAYLVSQEGRVLCVDLQKKMLDKLMKKAKRKNADNRIIPLHCNTNSLKLEAYNEKVDFAFAMAVVHEVDNKASFFKQVYDACAPKAKFLFAEPTGHVTEGAMENSIQLAFEAGFEEVSRESIKKTHAILLRKPKKA